METREVLRLLNIEKAERRDLFEGPVAVFEDGSWRGLGQMPPRSPLIGVGTVITIVKNSDGADTSAFAPCGRGVLEYQDVNAPVQPVVVSCGIATDGMGRLTGVQWTSH